jgi:hypothetical protein
VGSAVFNVLIIGFCAIAAKKVINENFYKSIS